MVDVLAFELGDEILVLLLELFDILGLTNGLIGQLMNLILIVLHDRCQFNLVLSRFLQFTIQVFQFRNELAHLRFILSKTTSKNHHD